MRIDAQEIMLLNNKYGMKKMNEEPTPTTNPQEPTTKDGYAIMNAMDLQGRNNINFQGLNKFTKNLDYLNYIRKLGLCFLMATGITVAGTIPQSCSKPLEPPVEKEPCNITVINNNTTNINFDWSVLAPILQEFVDNQRLSIGQRNEILAYLKDFNGTFNEALAYIAQIAGNTQVAVDLLKESTELQTQAIQVMITNGKTDTEAKAILEQILNSSLSSNEKVGKIYDAMGDITTYLPLFLNELKQINTNILQNTMTAELNGKIAHKDAMAIRTFVELVYKSSEHSNYLTARSINLLNEFYMAYLQGKMTLLDILKSISMDIKGLRQDMNNNFETTIKAINDGSAKIDVLIESRDEYAAQLAIIIAQNEALYDAVVKRVEQGATLIEIAEELNISVEELKEKLDNLDIKVTVDAELSPEQLNAILNSIDNVAEIGEGNQAFLNTLVALTQYHNEQTEENHKEAMDAFDELIELGKVNNSFLESIDNKMSIANTALLAIYDQLKAKAGTDEKILAKMDAVLAMIEKVKNNTDYCHVDGETMIDYLKQILEHEYCKCKCEGSNEGADLLQDLEKTFGEQ